MELWELIKPDEIDFSDIDYACDKLENFLAVNKLRDSNEKSDAVDILILSLGLDRDKIKHAALRTGKITSNGGSALLGMLIGLWINESMKLKDTNSEDSAIPS